ncbi:MAG: TRAP-type C4-dicarboxylate transport system, substrate-binding protein [Myxococcaceae bacterium]|jgi:TRAP-type C4-dicarboxylate transport system substrate-binding protein|nr:TRAP-type C4-dicarboxylate transport system, substrate-binding protein [Myxococcaceae bacterium]
MRILPLASLVSALLLTGTVAPAADPLELKIAALAPTGSADMTLLTKAASDLQDRTSGRVLVKYFSVGNHGDEHDAVRKMNLQQLQGSYLTGVGLAFIDESIRVFELPRLFASAAEADYAMDQLWPYFQKKFEAKGFRLDDRVGAIFGQFLSANEIKSADDLKAQKVGLWTDDVVMRALYKQLGVAGVPLGEAEVQPAFLSGRINAAYSSPLTATEQQWDTKIKYVSSAPVSLGLTALVLKLDSFKKMSTADQQLFANYSKAESITLRSGQRTNEDAAQKSIIRKGVTVTVATAAVNAALDTASQAVWAGLTDKVFTKAELAMVLKSRDEYRAKHSAH